MTYVGQTWEYHRIALTGDLLKVTADRNMLRTALGRGKKIVNRLEFAVVLRGTPAPSALP